MFKRLLTLLGLGASTTAHPAAANLLENALLGIKAIIATGEADYAKIHGVAVQTIMQVKGIITDFEAQFAALHGGTVPVVPPTTTPVTTTDAPK